MPDDWDKQHHQIDNSVISRADDSVYTAWTLVCNLNRYHPKTDKFIMIALFSSKFCHWFCAGSLACRCTGNKAWNPDWKMLGSGFNNYPMAICELQIRWNTKNLWFVVIWSGFTSILMLPLTGSSQAEYRSLLATLIPDILLYPGTHIHVGSTLLYNYPVLW